MRFPQWFLTWVEACSLKQLPLVEESIDEVWVVLGLMNQAGVNNL